MAFSRLLSLRNEDTYGNDKNKRLRPANSHMTVIKVVCVGDSGCGKTCMIRSFRNGTPPTRIDDIPSTLDTYHVRVSQNVTLEIRDTSGTESFDRLRPLSYTGSSMVLICFAINDPHSFYNVYDKWIPEIKIRCPGVPYILVGLKSDTRNSTAQRPNSTSTTSTTSTTSSASTNSVRSLVSRAEAKNITFSHGGLSYVECTSYQSNTVRDIFKEIVAFEMTALNRNS